MGPSLKALGTERGLRGINRSLNVPHLHPPPPFFYMGSFGCKSAQATQRYCVHAAEEQEVHPGPERGRSISLWPPPSLRKTSWDRKALHCNDHTGDSYTTALHQEPIEYLP